MPRSSNDLVLTSRTVWLGVCLLLLASAASRAAEIELVSKASVTVISDTAAGASFIDPPPDLSFTQPSTPPISADGRYAVFVSDAPNLAPGQQHEGIVRNDVFLYDRVAGTRTLIDRSTRFADTPSNAGASRPAISADGRYVAFVSSSTDLFPGQTGPQVNNVFLWDRMTGAVTLVSHASGSPTQSANGGSSLAALNEDGRYVVFVSGANDLVAGQVEGASTDVFVFDRVSGNTTLVSRTADSPTQEAGARDDVPSISADGRWITFNSSRSNVVPGQVDTNGRPDTFLFDRTTGTTTLVSHAAGSPDTAGACCSGFLFLFDPRPLRISADGRYVAFTSPNTDLVPGQSSFGLNVFLYDRMTDTTVLVSRTSDSPTTGAGNSALAGLGTDGRFVAFTISNDVYLFDRDAGTHVLVSHTSASATTGGNQPSDSAVLSDDGSWVAFASAATDLVAGQTDGNGDSDIFLFERASGTVRLISHASGSAMTAGNGLSLGPYLSEDGSQLVFTSEAADLVSGVADLNESKDVFLHDRAAETTTVVSLRDPDLPPLTSDAASQASAISQDGRFVVFLSAAIDIVPGQSDANGADSDIFLYDHETQVTVLVSRSAASPTQTGNGRSERPALSADGRFVAFHSAATDLVTGQSDGNAGDDVFLYDRVAGTTTLVSRSSASAETAGNAASSAPALSADGRFVAFQSGATDLVSGQSDANGASDVFLYDRVGGTTALVSRTDGSTTGTANGGSSAPAVNADGRLIAFQSDATDLIPGQVDTNGASDVFFYDRIADATVLASRANGTQTTTGNASSTGPVLDASGSVVAFRSEATNLSPADSDSFVDLYLFEPASQAMTYVRGVWPASPVAFSADGRFLAFESSLTDLVPGQVDRNSQPFSLGLDVFLLDRLAGVTTLVSHSLASPTTTGFAGISRFPALSADGRYVAFWSQAHDLVPEPPPGQSPRRQHVSFRPLDGSQPDGDPSGGRFADPRLHWAAGDQRYRPCHCLHHLRRPCYGGLQPPERRLSLDRRPGRPRLLHPHPLPPVRQPHPVRRPGACFR